MAKSWVKSVKYITCTSANGPTIQREKRFENQLGVGNASSKWEIKSEKMMSKSGKIKSIEWQNGE